MDAPAILLVQIHVNSPAPHGLNPGERNRCSLNPRRPLETETKFAWRGSTFFDFSSVLEYHIMNAYIGLSSTCFTFGLPRTLGLRFLQSYFFPFQCIQIHGNRTYICHRFFQVTNLNLSVIKTYVRDLVKPSYIRQLIILLPLLNPFFKFFL